MYVYVCVIGPGERRRGHGLRLESGAQGRVVGVYALEVRSKRLLSEANTNSNSASGTACHKAMDMG